MRNSVILLKIAIKLRRPLISASFWSLGGAHTLALADRSSRRCVLDIDWIPQRVPLPFRWLGMTQRWVFHTCTFHDCDGVVHLWLLDRVLMRRLIEDRLRGLHFRSFVFLRNRIRYARLQLGYHLLQRFVLCLFVIYLVLQIKRCLIRVVDLLLQLWNLCGCFLDFRLQLCFLIMHWGIFLLKLGNPLTKPFGICLRRFCDRSFFFGALDQRFYIVGVYTLLSQVVWF